MKTLLLFTFTLISLFSSAQRIALLSSNLKQPIIYTDSVTVEQIKSGYFPVETNKVDSFLANLLYLTNLVDNGKNGMRSKIQSFQLKSGKTTFEVYRVPYAYGDRFKITGITNLDYITAKSLIGNDNISNKKTFNKINSIIEYITNNKSFFESKYREITPKEYNVVVKSD